MMVRSSDCSESAANSRRSCRMCSMSSAAACGAPCIRATSRGRPYWAQPPWMASVTPSVNATSEVPFGKVVLRVEYASLSSTPQAAPLLP
ncbi:Uncharacterised protein [Bordetella pertussis]|nr:Uncharacterised protein [Bordetella pertussis]